MVADHLALDVMLPFPGATAVRVLSLGDLMSDVLKRITFNADQCGGRPCIRGMRIRVVDVLDLLASGLTQDEVLAEVPDLERDDIVACLRYASSRVDHPPSAV